jgi:alkanesulfonate monooxygenase SsuD/methylene tetrahydromethanopterin reductase-like flavin-dependent oxidoreductase (luciferase family)
MIQHAETLGFHRYWIGEHHNGEQCANPLLLGTVLLGLTERIRVGTGVLGLTVRSPEMVGEDLDLVRTLFGDRFDLGVGRGLVGVSKSLRPLLLDGRNEGRVRDDFPARVTQLYKRNVNNWPEAQPLWIAGTSEETARLAAQLGVGFCTSLYHASSISAASATVAMYRRRFKPSSTVSKPYVMLVLSGLCATSPEDALGHLSVFFHGSKEPIASLEDLTERAVGPWLFAGNGQLARERIERAVNYFEPDEVMLHNLTPWGPSSEQIESQSLRLVAEAFGLPARSRFT